jgi:hypothetical protein
VRVSVQSFRLAAGSAARPGLRFATAGADGTAMAIYSLGGFRSINGGDAVDYPSH